LKITLKYSCIAILVCRFGFAKAQTDSLTAIYQNAYTIINNMLIGKEPISFKKAVFVSENAFYKNTLSYKNFDFYINFLVKLSEAHRKANPLKNYNYEDSTAVSISGSVFKIMKDSLFDNKHELIIKPFVYDFEDTFGETDWTKMFVTKLLSTNTGNCHSMPFLYKILCEEQNVNAYLAYAPNHIYIKQRNKKDGWYNTEITSGVFPIDAWVMASGYVSTETIKNSLYMDTLSQKQSLAQCLIDLARGYERLKKVDYYDFVLQCCNTALLYNPHYVEGLLYKSETLKKQYDNFNALSLMENAKQIYPQMQTAYITVAKLGYREIPDEMYYKWITSLEKDKEKYQNKQINRTFNKGN